MNAQSTCVHLQGGHLSKCEAYAPSDVQRLDTDLATYLAFTGAHSPTPLLKGVYSRVNHDEQLLRDARLSLPTQDPDLVQARETAIVLPYRGIPAVLCTACLSTSRYEGTRCKRIMVFVALTLLSGCCSS